MQTRSGMTRVAQPPKQAAYDQASNPASQPPYEQRAPASRNNQHGGSIAARRTADSQPSSDEALSRIEQERKLAELNKQSTPDVDLEYGVEQQPAEGYIAESVEHKGEGIRRAQASNRAVGHPGFGEQGDLAAHMDQKRAEHDRLLNEKAGHGSSAGEQDVAEREAVRESKLKQDENVDVESSVKEASANPVVTYE